MTTRWISASLSAHLNSNRKQGRYHRDQYSTSRYSLPRRELRYWYRRLFCTLITRSQWSLNFQPLESIPSSRFYTIRSRLTRCWSGRPRRRTSTSRIWARSTPASKSNKSAPTATRTPLSSSTNTPGQSHQNHRTSLRWNIHLRFQGYSRVLDTGLIVLVETLLNSPAGVRQRALIFSYPTLRLTLVRLKSGIRRNVLCMSWITAATQQRFSSTPIRRTSSSYRNTSELSTLKQNSVSLSSSHQSIPWTTTRGFTALGVTILSCTWTSWGLVTTYWLNHCPCSRGISRYSGERSSMGRGIWRRRSRRGRRFSGVRWRRWRRRCWRSLKNLTRRTEARTATAQTASNGK